MSYAPRSACSNKLSLYETSHSSFLFLYRLAPAMVPKATIGVNAERTRRAERVRRRQDERRSGQRRAHGETFGETLRFDRGAVDD